MSHKPGHVHRSSKMSHKPEHVHRSFKKVSHPFIDPSTLKGFKRIEDFRDDYRGSTFWIIGSDPNLDFYPDDFFDDKLSIAISASCIAFPNSTYLLVILTPVADAIARARPDFLSKCIMSLNCTRAKFKPYWEQLDPFWKDYGLDPIYMKLMEGSRDVQTIPDWRRMVRQIFGNDLVEFVQPTSSIHYAMGIAAILGAKKIILVGCSHKSTKYLFHAQKRGMWIFHWENRPGGKREYPASYINGRIPELASMRRDTKRFKRVFAKYGVEIVRHRYDEIKKKFIFEEI